MADVEIDIRQLVSQLKTAHFRSYLISQGWEEMPSRYADQLYFQGEVHEGGERYELYLPTAPRSARYQTHVMRAIYKLCGIEDRQPAEIARDMLARPVADPPIAETPAQQSPGVTRLRVRNSDSGPLHVSIDWPPRKHDILPGEAIELVCKVGEAGVLEIERGEGTLIVRMPGK
jgi:hypothetical protein